MIQLERETLYNEDQNVPTYLGRLGGNGGSIDVYAYSDQQYDDAGNVHEMLDPNDVFLSAPGVDGVMAYGAIYDLKAIGNGSGAPTDVFQKQYEQDNPSQLNLLTQSAPLPIPRFPNRTFKATVLDQ
ncbi:major capsid protein [Ochrobactrum sp. WV_118_8]